MKTKPKLKTIDITPTWPEAARMLMALLESGTLEGRSYAQKEILRMAFIAEEHTKCAKKKARKS